MEYFSNCCVFYWPCCTFFREVSFLDYADTAEAAFSSAGGHWAKFSVHIRSELQWIILNLPQNLRLNLTSLSLPIKQIIMINSQTTGDSSISSFVCHRLEAMLFIFSLWRRISCRYRKYFCSYIFWVIFILSRLLRHTFHQVGIIGWEFSYLLSNISLIFFNWNKLKVLLN